MIIDSYRKPTYQCRYCGRSIFFDDDYSKNDYGEYICAWCSNEEDDDDDDSEGDD